MSATVLSWPAEPIDSYRSTSVDSLRAAALDLLLKRYSMSPKRLREPGPTDAELLVVARAALRAPDHGKLVPFRFVAIRGAQLHRLAELFLDYGRRQGKSGAELDAEVTRAIQAPVVLAVVARIDSNHPKVPATEQWACVGGAIANSVMALHALGFGAKMLSGARTADPVIAAAFCEQRETLVGWISAGTATAPLTPREPIDPGTIVRQF